MIVNRAFFGKENCLKVTLNNEKECYFHWGIKNKEKYEWVKVKFNDLELAEMINIFKGKKRSVAFFHEFKGNKRQIWVNSKDDFTFVKVKELSKSLTQAEVTVMRILLENIIWRMSS